MGKITVFPVKEESDKTVYDNSAYIFLENSLNIRSHKIIVFIFLNFDKYILCRVKLLDMIRPLIYRNQAQKKNKSSHLNKICP